MRVFRTFPARWLASLALVAMALSAPVQATETDPYHVEFEQVAEDIWVAVRPQSTRAPVVGNGAIIINDDHVVVVDGNGFPLVAERVIAGIRARTDKPVRYLINTHWHGDHNLGNDRFRDAYPGVNIIAHRFTRQAMLGAPMDYLAKEKESIVAEMQGVADLLEAGQLPDGSDIPAHLVPMFTDLVAHRALLEQQVLASKVTPPNLVFERELTLHSPSREIQVRFLGKANTAGDAVVWLPAERILVTGDIVVHPTPYGFYSNPESWAGVIAQLIDLEPRLVIPGHGAVMNDTAYLEKLRALFTWVHTEVAQRIQGGMSLEEIRDDLDFSAQSAEFTGGDAWLESRFRAWFAQPIVEAAWNEIMGIDSEPLESSGQD